MRALCICVHWLTCLIDIYWTWLIYTLRSLTHCESFPHTCCHSDRSVCFLAIQICDFLPPGFQCAHCCITLVSRLKTQHSIGPLSQPNRSRLPRRYYQLQVSECYRRSCLCIVCDNNTFCSGPQAWNYWSLARTRAEAVHCYSGCQSRTSHRHKCVTDSVFALLVLLGQWFSSHGPSGTAECRQW